MATTFLSLVIMFAVALGVMVGVVFGFALLNRCCSSSDPTQDIRPFLLSIVLTAVSFIIGLVYAARVEILLPYLSVFLGAMALLLMTLKGQGASREGGYFLVCLCGVCLLPSDLPLIAVMPWVMYPALGLSLYMMMRLFMIMDRVPNLSLITLMAQGVLLYFLTRLTILPVWFASTMFYLFFAIVAAAQTMKLISGKTILGLFAAPVVGWELGMIWVWVMAQGYPALPAVVFGYDLLEVIIATALTLKITGRVCPLAVPFLIEQAQMVATKEQKLSRYMLVMLILLSLIGLAMTGDNTKNYYSWRWLMICQGVVLLGFWMRLRNWGQAQPRLRDLWGDLKQGLREVKKEMTTVPLKKEAVKKTMSSKKVSKRSTHRKKK